LSRPLRLLIVYETLYPDHAGGIETRNHELARALAGRGHHVTLAGFGRPAGTAGSGERGAPIPGVERRLLGGPRALYDRTGRRRHRRAMEFAWRALALSPRRFDVVETASMPFFHLPGLATACRVAGVPLLVVWFEVWGAYWRSYVGTARAPLYRLFERAAARLGSRVAATSALGRDRLKVLRRLRGERPGEGVALVPCGVDLPAVERAAGPAAAAPVGPPVVAAGRLLAHKRVELLIEALPLLADLAPGSPLAAVFGDGPERGRLEARAEALGVRDRLVFHGQVESLAAVWRGFGAARLAVHPSAREGFGLVPLEAMAAGLPVVHCRSRESAVGELVRDGVEGLSTEPTPAALAAAVRALLADEARRRTLASAARKRAAEFAWPRLAAEYEHLLRGMAGA
jgi:glycosyltransferase involved in cell wall biosynthesis